MFLSFSLPSSLKSTNKNVEKIDIKFDIKLLIITSKQRLRENWGTLSQLFPPLPVLRSNQLSLPELQSLPTGLPAECTGPVQRENPPASSEVKNLRMVTAEC